MERIDWNKRYLDELGKYLGTDDEQQRNTEEHKKKKKPMTCSLDEYEGTYEDKGYGTLEIKIDGDELYAYYNTMVLPLVHRTADVFSLQLPDFEFEVFARFHTDLNGAINAFEAGLDLKPDKGILFKKKLLV
jgi:hypothetical protein